MEDVESTLDSVVSGRYEELDTTRMSGLKMVHREKFYANVVLTWSFPTYLKGSSPLRLRGRLRSLRGGG